MSYAFFDFDKTILDGDAGPKFGSFVWRQWREETRENDSAAKGAAKRGMLWTRMVPYITWMSVQTCLYKARAIRRSTVVRNAYRGLRGVPVAPLEEQMVEFVEDYVRSHLFQEIVDEMQDHVAKGRKLVIITTGMERLVSKILPHLPGPPELVGCKLEEKNGKLTGRVTEGPLYGADKANIVRAYCRAAGADPAECFAYTDHYSDKHMLEAVGHGVVVNPAPRMAKLANERGWRILNPKPT